MAFIFLSIPRPDDKDKGPSFSARHTRLQRSLAVLPKARGSTPYQKIVITPSRVTDVCAALRGEREHDRPY